MEEVCRGKNKTKQHISVLHNRKSGKQTDKHLGDILLFVSSAIINWHLFIILKRKKKSYSGILYVNLSVRNQDYLIFINHLNIYIQTLKVKDIQKSQGVEVILLESCLKTQKCQSKS